MSFSAHRLLRSRFNAGLSTQHRLRFGLWSRQRAYLPAGRFVANYASKSDSLLPRECGSTGNHLKFSAASSLAALADRFPQGIPADYDFDYDFDSDFHSDLDCEFDSDFAFDYYARGDDILETQSLESQSTIESSHKDESLTESTSPSRSPRANRVWGGQHISEYKTPNIVFETLAFVDGQLTLKERVVSTFALDQDNRLRSKCLYYDGSQIREWTRVCMEIYKAKFYQREIQEEFVRRDLDSSDLDLLEKIRTDCQGSFREAWEGLEKTQKAAHWARLSLWLLQTSPELAWEFLLVTSQSADRPMFVMVARAIMLLDAFHAKELQSLELRGHTYLSVIETCLDPESWPIIFLPQKPVRFYLQKVAKDAREKVYSAYYRIRNRQIQTKAETFICFMRLFTEFGDVRRALSTLRISLSLEQPNCTIQSQAVMRQCCKLLLQDSVKDLPTGRNFRILPELLEMGLQPNLSIMNIVLSNAFKTGDPQLGNDMLNFMKAQGLEPDSYTYLILLTDAVARGDRERVDELIREISPREELRKNHWIASKIFHSHFVFTTKHNGSESDPAGIFYSLLDMYNQLYDLTPLKELSILPPEYAPLTEGDNEQPSVVALFLVIATYLRCQKRPGIVKRVYSSFRSLASQGNSTIAPLLTTDHIFNEFLIAMRNDPDALRPCVQLVEEMLQSTAKEQADGTPLVYAKPTVRTWTLLLSAFIYNRQMVGAEKVKEMMAKYGVQYTTSTWNVIISGFAKLQNIPEVAAGIKAMEAEGLTIDAYTLKSIRYLRDPERLWVAVEELDGHPDLELETLEPSFAEEEDLAMEDELLLEKGLERLGQSSAAK